MRRWLAFCTLLLILGLATTIGVAWLSAGIPHDWQAQRLDLGFTDRSYGSCNGWDVREWRGRGRRILHLTPLDRGEEPHDGPPFAAPSWSLANDPPPAASRRVVEDERGWPFRSLCFRWRQPTVPLIAPGDVIDGGLAIQQFDLTIPSAGGSVILASYDDDYLDIEKARALPIRPLPGAVASTVFYAFAWLLVVLARGTPAWIRGHLRRRRQRCIRCRYPSPDGSQRCPECGWDRDAQLPFLRASRLVTTGLVACIVVCGTAALGVTLVRRFDRPAPIFLAAQNDDVTTVRALLDAGTDPETRASFDGFGAIAMQNTTPLMWAAAHESMDTLELLIERGADVVVEAGFGKTPMLVAAEAGKAGAIRRLAAASADVHRGSAYRTPLYVATTRNHLDAMSALIELGADVDAHEPGECALAGAARAAGPEAIALLLEAGAADGPADDDAGTPLSVAAWTGRLDNIRALLDAGAAVDPDRGPMPLERAVDKGHGDAAILLLDAGASVERCAEPLIWHAAMSDLTHVAARLIDAGADPNRPSSFDEASTPLRTAVWRGNIELARLLLDAGANTNGPGLLHELAWTEPSDDMIEFVMTTLRIDVDEVDDEGSTALLWAVAWDNVPLVQRLLREGADPRIANKSGLTPMAIALGPGEFVLDSSGMTRDPGDTSEEIVAALRRALDEP